MIKTEVFPATLIKRYKRFLADVVLADGTETTMHIANTGAMTGCGSPGDTIWYSKSDNPKRKYPFSWELTELNNGEIICVNTHRANDFVEYAIKQNEIETLSCYQGLKREAKYGQENSKIDILLSGDNLPDKYVEVKSVTLKGEDPGQGFFPDAKTTRGQKHLRELMEMVEQGHQATLVFAIMHTGIRHVKPASHIDSLYSELFNLAVEKGVEVIFHRIKLDQHFIFSD